MDIIGLSSFFNHCDIFSLQSYWIQCKNAK